MARHLRSSSEHYPGGDGRVGSSCEAGMEEEEDEERSPIYSLSKSSMDVLMSTGPPHLRDPAWARLDLRRSASQHTHTAPDTHPFQHIRSHTPQFPHLPQHSNTHQHTYAPLHSHVHGFPLGIERWSANVERWSVCSRSSTPDTIIWTGGTTRPWSLNAESPYSHSPSSPCSRFASPPPTPSPFISPLQTPTASPLRTHAASPLTLPQHTPPRIPCTDEGCSPHTPIPPSPSPHPSPSPSRSSRGLDVHGLEVRGSSQDVLPQLECNTVGTECGERPLSLSLCTNHSGTQPMESGLGSPVDGQAQESVLQHENLRSRYRVSKDRLGLAWLPRHTCAAGPCPCRGHSSVLASSLSDSRLGGCCCDQASRAFREEGTMTSLKELRDVGVQAGSPLGSKLNGSHSYMGSHSILGSPPGSLLSLRSSVGSQSNLVSSSSSMFQLDSPKEEDGEDWEGDTVWESSSPPAELGGRRRSCLKVQREECNVGKQRDAFARRTSMKQVQWDEDGMTWDVYGACLDPEELNTAIQRHLQLKTKEIRETRHSIGSAGMTGTIANENPTMATTPKTPTAPGTPAVTTTTIETGAEDTRGLVEEVELGREEGSKGEGGGREGKGEGGGEAEGEGERDGGGGGDGEREEKGGAEAGGTPMLQHKPSSCDSGRIRKKSGVVMRTLKKPVCCVRSSKSHD